MNRPGWIEISRRIAPKFTLGVTCQFLAFLAALIYSPAFADAPIPWTELKLRDTAGEPVAIEPDALTVVAFLGTECPLAKLYGPRLQALADEHADSGVRFLGVVSNIQDSPAEIDRYARTHAIRFDIVKDADQSVVSAFGATRTPEVFVVDARGRVRYQGRIDDQYEPGVKRAKPTRHDLRDAIEALIAGKKIEQKRTEGVGCLITRIDSLDSPRTEAATVTFNRDIAPILNQHCVECHRESEIAPMALTDYDEVVGWSQMVLEVIDEGRMPPWHADPDVGSFIGARRLPAEGRNKIERWINEGLAEGDPEDLPPAPTWASGWQLPTEPDATFSVADKPFTVPADGVVEYQYFVVDPQWKEDRWIRSAQVIPGNASVVHHVIAFIRPPDGSDFGGIGWLSAYVPGQRTIELPSGYARFIPAGSKLVFQMHYTPNGRETEDLTRIGIWEADPGKVTHEVFTQMAINHEFEIPPGEKNYCVDMSVNSFPPNARMLGITPHMHLRGKSFELVAKRGNAESQALLKVPNYDFNWQHWYAFSEPIDLENVDSLAMKVIFDNSRKNPFNPSPSEYVSWGDQTWEEMAVAFFDVSIPRGGPRYRQRKWQAPTEEEKESMERKVREHVEAFLSAMDVNGDGTVEREEVPLPFRKFGFGRLDKNRDRKIERYEIRAAAERRL